ncbi:5-formyltetrahydrofolate cyclo-ligase [Fructilactobacillus myrtifloralis]|uniref:5-formyltetrahydrofolate cyclo-ligase n=1 Tax=Fructilactobacillus myrtifloralis TaxID=2940301 RepID=A0ABY5BQD9_9LACO|nr:5-formyltetrahydrofolate cyclo-ligase [Fructilactobacillus myrtifloralis]USS85268.1 5-formyltetrahydrofolate cyclo-ligase [Fructilactobacillus myrtifloralis]
MKTAIRTTVLHKLAQQAQPASRFTELYQRLFATSVWQEAQVVAVTISLPHELPTQPMISQAQRQGKLVVIPRTVPHRELRFYPLTPKTCLAKTKFGVWEPQNGTALTKDQIDLVLVPGVAFCRHNHHRIGYGGGFYDRFLASFPGQTIALAQREQVVEQPWTPDPFDVPVQQLLVEDEHG